MAKNKELLAAIQNTSELRLPKYDNVRNNALDALLFSDPLDAPAFRAAVTKGAPLWNQFGTIMQAPQTNYWLSQNEEKPGYFTSDGFLDPSLSESFEKIRQAAAEQRVKFALTGVDTEVLVGLLTTDFTDNGKKLREYLELKQNSLGVKFNEMHGWNPANEDVLTKAALNNIRIEAANQLLLKVLASPGLANPDLFDNLIKAHTAKNLGNIKTAALALINAAHIDLQGAPPTTFTDALTLELTDEIIAEATVKRDELIENKKKLDIKDVGERFLRQKIEDTSTLTPVFLAEANLDTFVDSLFLLPPYNQFSPTDKDHFKQHNDYRVMAANVQKDLRERFLQNQLLNTGMTDPEAVTLLNKDKDNIKAELKLRVVGIDAVIDNTTIDDNNIGSFKIALLKNRLAKLGDLTRVDELVKATKLEDFVPKLIPLLGNDGAHAPQNANLAFLKQEHLTGLRDVVRDRLAVLKRDETAKKFADEVEKYSRLGKDAHPQLIELFSQLPTDKQKEIMKQGKEKELLFVINAKSAEEIKYYWGSKDAKGNNLDLTGLVQENERAAAFKQIMNPTIAKVMMGLSSVTPAMVGKINEALLAERGNSFDNVGTNTYKNFIDKLHTACGAPAVPFDATAASTEFYKAFNLTDHNDANLLDASVNATPTTVSEKIQDEHKNNKPLFAAHEAAPQLVMHNGKQIQGALDPTQKRFVEIIARVAGADHLNINDNDDPYQITLPIKLLYNKFILSTNVHEFLDNLISEDAANSDPAKRTLKNELSREFTPSVYNELKGMRVKSRFSLDDPKKLSIINEIEIDLERLQKSKPAIEKHKGHLKALAEDLNSLPALYSGANEAKAKSKAEKMLVEYKALEKQCDTIIVHLERVQAQLKTSFDNAPSSVGLSPGVQEKLDPLRDKLKKEIEDVGKQLEFYKEIKQKISGEKGALEKIKGIQNRKLTAVMETASTTYSELDLADIRKIDTDIVFRIKPEARTPNITTAATNINDDSPTLLNIPQQGKVLGINTFYGTKTDANNQPVDIKGRIAINYHPEGSIPHSTLVGKDVVSSRPIKVMIAVPVDDPVHRADQSLRAAKELLKDWDGESLIKLKGWQGKEKEVQFLWTALCVLGEHHPKFSRDKISVTGTANWKPEQERSWRGFTEDSVYNKVFKGKASGTTAEHVREFTSMINPKKRENVDKGIKKSTSFYRDTLTDTKEHNIETEVNKDLAVEGKAKTLGGG